MVLSNRKKLILVSARARGRGEGGKGTTYSSILKFNHRIRRPSFQDDELDIGELGESLLNNRFFRSWYKTSNSN